MTTEQADELQGVVRRNIRVLMALRNLDGPRQLAAVSGKPENWIAQKQSGRRRWHLDDLPAIAAALGVQSLDLLREVAELVAAATPTGTEGQRSSAVTDGSTGRWSDRGQHLRLVPPLVGDSASDYPDVTGQAVTLSGVTPRSGDADAA